MVETHKTLVMNNIVKVYKTENVSVNGHHKLIISENSEYHISLVAREDLKHEFYPSLILSRITGIDIHTDWDLGFLKDPTLKEYTKYSDRNYDKLITRNPDLFKLHTDCVKTDRHKKDLWHGAVSKFNKNDLGYFLSFELITRPKWVEEVQRKLEDKFKFSFQFVSSPETSNKLTCAFNAGEIKELNLTLDNLNFYK